MPWSTNINFHDFAQAFTLIVVWLIFPVAIVGAGLIPSLLSKELANAIARIIKPRSLANEAKNMPGHDADGGGPGEQSVTEK